MDVKKVMFDELRRRWEQEFKESLAILSRENIERKYPLAPQEKALSFLYGELRKAKIALGRAEGKPNSAEERENLQNKIDGIDWILGKFFEGEKQ
jgi:hypothetical protein